MEVEVEDFSEPIPESWRERGDSDGIVGRRRVTFTAGRSLNPRGRPLEKRTAAKSFIVSRFLPFLGHRSSDGETLLSPSKGYDVAEVLLRDGNTNSCENRLAMLMDTWRRANVLVCF